MGSRAAALFFAAAAIVACKRPPFGDVGGDASSTSPAHADPAAAWLGKWHGTGSFVITATNTKPITGGVTMDITVERGDGSSVIRIVTTDGKGYDLSLDPAHPDTATTGGAIDQTTTVTDTHGHYVATAKLSGGKMHLVQTSSAHGTFQFDNLHAQGDAKTVTTVDLDRVK